MKAFGEAVQALRGAFELLQKLQKCRDNLGPPKTHVLQAAVTLGKSCEALDTLEAIENCIDRSSTTLKLHSSVQVGYISSQVWNTSTCQ